MFESRDVNLIQLLAADVIANDPTWREGKMQLDQLAQKSRLTNDWFIVKRLHPRWSAEHEKSVRRSVE